MNSKELAGEMAHQALAVDPRDSIAVALADLHKGQKCTVRVGSGSIEIELLERIPFGRKFALHPIPRGTSVLEYGEVIGESSSDIDAGAWVDHHNVMMESSTHIQYPGSVCPGDRNE